MYYKIKTKSLTLITFLCLGLMFNPLQVNAKNKPQLSTKNVILTKGESQTIKLNNVNKKVKWKIKNKKIASIKTKGKNKQKCIITAKRTGKTTITAIVNNKSYKLKLNVKKTVDKEDEDIEAVSVYQTSITLVNEKGEKVSGYVVINGKRQLVDGSITINDKKNTTFSVENVNETSNYNCAISSISYNEETYYIVRSYVYEIKTEMLENELKELLKSSVDITNTTLEYDIDGNIIPQVGNATRVEEINVAMNDGSYKIYTIFICYHSTGIFYDVLNIYNV